MCMIFILRETCTAVREWACWYQQHKQSPLILTHWTQKITMTDDVGNPGPDLGQAQICGGVKPVNRIQYFWHIFKVIHQLNRTILTLVKIGPMVWEEKIFQSMKDGRQDRI